MTEAPLANSAEARTETGELKDQSPTTETLKKLEPTEVKTEAKVEPKVEDKTEKKPEEKSELNKDEKKEPSKAPEAYADFKAPEGMVLDKEALAKATPIFKELGLDQAAAQKLVDTYATLTREAADAPFKLWADMQKEWTDKLKADPVIGSKLPEVKETVSRALASLNDPALEKDFRYAMDITGAGNHPAFARVFFELAKQYVEGKGVSGRGPSPHGQAKPGDRPASAAAAIYPNLS